MSLDEIKSELVKAHREQDWDRAADLSQLKEEAKRRRYCADCGVRIDDGAIHCHMHDQQSRRRRSLPASSRLSDHQRKVLKCWKQHFSLQQAAIELNMKYRAVKTTLRRARVALGLRNTYQLAAWLAKTAMLLLIFTGCAIAQPNLTPPAVSKDLVKGTVATCTLNFAWDYSYIATVDGFKLYQGVSPRAYTNTVVVLGDTARTGSITNVPVAITNYFAVTAYLGALESEYSAELVYVPKPGAPSNFRITAQTAKTLAGPWTTFTNMPPAVVANTGEDAYFRLQIAQEN